MRRNLPLLFTVILILSACSIAPQRPAQPAADVGGDGAPAAVPPQSLAAAASGAVVYELAADGSLRSIDVTLGHELVLADPTSQYQNLPWAPAPDGHSVAVITGRWTVKGGTPLRAALWTVNVDSSEPGKLLDLTPEEPIDLPPHALQSVQPALVGGLQRVNWTPEGREIILTSAHEGLVDLYAVAVDGSTVRRHALSRRPAAGL